MSSEIKSTTVQTNSLKDKTGTRVLASDSGSAWSWGAGVPSGSIVQVQSKAFLGKQTITANTFTEVGTGASGANGEPLTITMSVGSGNKILFSGSCYAGGNTRYAGLIVTLDSTGTYTWGQDTSGPSDSIMRGAEDNNQARVLSTFAINESVTHYTFVLWSTSFNFLYTPSDTSSHTYTVKAGNTYTTNSSNYMRINSSDNESNASHVHKTVSTFTALEVVA